MALGPFRRPHPLGAASTALLALLVTALCLGSASAAPAQDRPTVVIAFHPGGEEPRGTGRAPGETVFERLAARPALALGLMGATQGPYTRRQALLDLTAGNRVSRSGYQPDRVPAYRPLEDPRGWRIDGWDAVVGRAASAPVPIVPGLLASAAGGAAYVGATAEPALEAVVAAGRDGRIAEVSLGSPATLADRAQRALERRSLAIVGLPRGSAGDRALNALLQARAPDRLVVVIRRPPGSRSPQLLPFGVAGLSGGELLTSRTTRRPGLVAATDTAPTVLRWLGRPVPTAVVGRPITAQGERDVAALRDLDQRLRAVYPRRFPALYAVLGALTATALVLSLAGGRVGRRRALRVCALAVLWIPVMSLLAAALEPALAVELALISVGTVAIALVNDRILPWPRGPMLPALLAMPAYLADLALNSELIVRSLLGPNPRFGSRFYGIGNELEAALPVLLLVGLAALAGTAPRSRSLAALFAGALLVLGLGLGAGRLGAAVGAVITVGAAAAVAVVVLLPGRVTRRSLLLGALAVPAVGLGALAVIDVVTGGDAHFSAAVLGAEDGQALARTLIRRYELAWQSLTRGAMPLATLLAVGAAVMAWRRRGCLYAPVAGRPAWAAALLGGLAGSVAGSLANDSGPVLLVIGVFILAWATAYIQGDPELAHGAGEPNPAPAPPGADPEIAEPQASVPARAAGPARRRPAEGSSRRNASLE